jgi:hypothetical protein
MFGPMREQIASAVEKLEAELALREAASDSSDPEVVAAKEALEKGRAAGKEVSG